MKSPQGALNLCRVIWLCGMMGMAGRCYAEQVDEATAVPWGQEQSSGTVNLGVQFDEQQGDAYGNVLVPVVQRPSGLIFINPGGSWNAQDEQELNLGVGGRYLFADKNLIVGGNLFYDRRRTELDHTFNQMGCGVEFLSQWLDARANYYCPEEASKTADDYIVTTSVRQEHNEYWYAPTAQGHVISQYGYEVTDSYRYETLQHYVTTEKAMRGFDGELGALLPIPGVKEFMDVKAFVGYAGYNSNHGDEIAGMKGRVEVRPAPVVYLDAAWYEDEACYGANYSLGIRATLPFDFARLSKGGNPFAGAFAGFKPGRNQSQFAGRLVEMVIRDLHVRTEVSDPVEVFEDRQVIKKTLISHERTDFTEILAQDVTFVDSDSTGSLETGTWEHPYRQINAGVQNAVGSIVYVDSAQRPYHESVVLQDGILLWGSGTPIMGQHGSFQGGAYPVVIGGGTRPTLMLANHNLVTGFELIQPSGGGSSAVISGRNVTGIAIVNNAICGNRMAGSGVNLQGVSMASFSASVRDNTITDAAGAGVDIHVADVPDVAIDLSRNYIARNGGAGVNLEGVSVPNAVVEMRDLEVNGNGSDGVRIDLFGGSSVELTGVSAIGNGGDGISLDLYGYSSARAVFNNNTAANNHASGLRAAVISGGSVSVSCFDNQLTHNGADGMLMELNSGLDTLVMARENQVANNAGNGVYVQTLAPSDSVYDFGVAGTGMGQAGMNSFHGNGAYQVLFNGNGTLSAIGDWWGTPAPVDTVEFLAQGGGVIVVTPALAVSPVP